MSIPVAPHPCLHLVLSVFRVLAILTGVQWYLIVLICNSLMKYGVEHLPTLIFQCMSSLVKCRFRSFAYFLIMWFVFLLLNSNSSLSILDNSPFSEVSFANIFSQSVTRLLILLTVSFVKQKFLILIQSGSPVLSFMDMYSFSKWNYYYLLAYLTDRFGMKLFSFFFKTQGSVACF
uniref:Uncharacterized protein n=1 Tax=Equus asinus TaxID=9793 RepID=A0A9L0JH39_EQUAS